MGNMLNLTARDGNVLAVYQSKPDTAVRGGLVILQEIFGLNSHIRSVCDSFAEQGWHVVSPALFDPAEPDIELEYTSQGIARGRALKDQVDGRAESDIADMLNLIDHELRCAVIGYCWGGSLAWRMACRTVHASERRIDGAVCYYGGELPALSSLTPTCPVMAHFGKKDASIPLDGVEKFISAQPEVISHLYDADHGFNCDQRGQFSAEHAAVARQRTDSFLDKFIGR